MITDVVTRGGLGTEAELGRHHRNVARPSSFGSGNGQLNRQRWSKAQKQTSGIDWLRAHTYSSGQGQPPLNHGTRYAAAVTGQLPGAVNGNAIVFCAFAKFR